MEQVEGERAGEGDREAELARVLEQKEAETQRLVEERDRLSQQVCVYIFYTPGGRKDHVI